MLSNMIRLSTLRPRWKLATFDVTNTLLKFETSVGHQYAEIGKLYGINSDPSEISAAFKHNWKMMQLYYPNYGRNSGLSSKEWWRELIKRSFSYTLSTEKLNIISEHLFEVYRTEKCWSVATGIKEQLRCLQENNVVLGVISNFDERLDSVLVATGLRPYFNFVLASYVVCYEKPSKEIFKLALSKANGVGINASDAVHVGDNLELDYLAAKSAGWSAILLRDKKTIYQCYRK